MDPRRHIGRLDVDARVHEVVLLGLVVVVAHGEEQGVVDVRDDAGPRRAGPVPPIFGFRVDRAARARVEIGLVEAVAVPPVGEVGGVGERAVLLVGRCGVLELERALLRRLADTPPRVERDGGVVEQVVVVGSEER